MVVTKTCYEGEHGEALKPETQQRRQNMAETGALRTVGRNARGKCTVALIYMRLQLRLTNKQIVINTRQSGGISKRVC